MNPTDKTPVERRSGPRRTITITVSLPTAISSLIMLCIGFVCVFSIGILLGRGHNIEANIPQLERLMPQAGPTEQPRLIDHDSEQNPPQGTENPQAAAPSRSTAAQQTPQDSRNRVMDQGDLAYRESLKQKPTSSAAQRSASGQAKQPAGKTGQPSAGSADQQKSATEGQEIFNYVYQVAAYKDGGMSDKLASRLKTVGLKARTEKSVENGTTWYKTVVDFRGSPDDTNSLRAKLKDQGLTRLILRSKVPVKR